MEEKPEKRARRPRKRAAFYQKLLAFLFSALLLAAVAYLWLGRLENNPFGAPGAGAAVPPAGDFCALVEAIDVGQGSSTLIRAGDFAALIDGGERSAGLAVLAALRANGLSALDLVVLTHPHSDHYGGLIAVLESMPVRSFWMPAVPSWLAPTNDTYFALLDAIEKNGCTLSVKTAPETLALPGPVTLALLDGFLPQPENLNDTSLCLRLDAGEASFLFTGDGETPVEDRLREGGAPIDADVLFAGHHGSGSSSRPKFVEAVSPRASLISCGLQNDYGHPNPRVLERLAGCGPVFRTDLSASVFFTTDGATISIDDRGVRETLPAA